MPKGIKCNFFKVLYSVSYLFCCRVFRKPSNRPVKLKKHKVIAKAFEKRKELNNGRLSISFASTHEDPLGKTILLILKQVFF